MTVIYSAQLLGEGACQVGAAGSEWLRCRLCSDSGEDQVNQFFSNLLREVAYIFGYYM